MEERTLSLVSELTRKYEEIRALSDWGTLKSIVAMDKLNELLDRRALLLNEIAALPPVSAIDPSAMSDKKPYVRLVSLVKEITDADEWLAGRLTERMDQIREELKAKSLFRNKALPGYMRQKFALAS